jgi:Ca2+/Na+ antiporter
VTNALPTPNPLDKLHAKALTFARQWKHAALDPSAGAKVRASGMQSINNDEVEPLLLSEPAMNEDYDSDDEEEEEEDPREHFWKNLAIAGVLMVGGTVIVAIFSDPMVEVISVLGNLWGIPVFYISFVLTPFCSNASELVASLAFASKKRIANTSMTYSQLYGAVIMNNTMGLGIFFALIAFRGLAWTFTAETLTILLVVLAVGIPASFKVNWQLWWVFLNAPLYVLSIVFVYVLEHFVHWA